jgi:hypothetical protein
VVPEHPRRDNALTPDSPLVWHLGRHLSNGCLIPDDTLDFLAGLAGGVVVRGSKGARQAAALRSRGFGGRVWLDPAEYDHRAGERPDDKLWNPWVSRQDELLAVERISPGSFVDEHAEVDNLRKAIDTERLWLIEHGPGRCSIVVDVAWLRHRTETLAELLGEVQGPIALTIAGGWDPLARAGAVKGLVHVLRSGLDVFVLRSDLGALGALAHGATLAAFGTGTSMRHFVPKGKPAGGSGNRIPSVFVADILSFMKGSKLDQFPAAASPTCVLPCCNGRELRRFNVPETADAALKHNLSAVAGVAAKFLSAKSRSHRANVFRQLCLDAEVANAQLEAAARRKLRLSPQVRAWARIDPTPEPALDMPVR